MEILNVGPLEFLLVIVLALIVLGPQRMVTGARDIGRWINKMVKSPQWREVWTTSQEIRDLPKTIISETGLEETMKEFKQTTDELNQDLKTTTQELNSEINLASQEFNRELRTSPEAAPVNASILPPAAAPGEILPENPQTNLAEAVPAPAVEPVVVVDTVMDLPLVELNLSE
jgi:sec-independent protein translocase protein TatB